MPDLPALSPLALPGAALAAAAVALALAWVALRRVRRWSRLVRSATSPDVGEALRRLMDGLAPLEARLARVEAAVSPLERALPDRLLPPGVVLFRAYGNDGPPLSFSVALITPKGDGVVVTSLYGRDSVRMFAKPVSSGASPRELSPEELEALRLARAGGGARALGVPAEPLPVGRRRSSRA